MNDKTKRLFLKPCPLCGSAPLLQQYRYDPWGDGAGDATVYYYQCSGCGYIRSHELISTSYASDAKIREEAKKDWNSVTEEIITMMKEKMSVL